MTTTERELTEPVDLCEPDGTLAPAAIGWSRRPLHRSELPGPWGRRKRWDYWCVVCRDGALQLTLADLDWAGLAEVAFVPFAAGPEGRVARAFAVSPLALGIRLPPSLGEHPIRVRAPHLAVAITEGAGGTRLEARARTLRGALEAEVVVERPPGEESLNVVVPWSARTYQLTSKHVARPAEGWIRLGAMRFRVDAAHEGFGCLDHGRGVWPRDVVWSWGTAAAHVDTPAGRRRVGVQMGGHWTDGTGATENGVLVDGRLEKIGAPLEWRYDLGDATAPWTVRDAGGEIDLTFVPIVVRRHRVELGIARSRLHLGFGRWSGSVRALGETYVLRDALGWAEEHRARW